MLQTFSQLRISRFPFLFIQLPKNKNSVRICLGSDGKLKEQTIILSPVLPKMACKTVFKSCCLTKT